MLSNPRMAANEALKACEDAEEDRRQVRIQVFVHLSLAWSLVGFRIQVFVHVGLGF